MQKFILFSAVNGALYTVLKPNQN